jgi:hypothetical protein
VRERPAASVNIERRKQPEILMPRLPAKSAIEPARMRQQPLARLQKLFDDHSQGESRAEYLRVNRSRPRWEDEESAKDAQVAKTIESKFLRHNPLI